MLRTHTCGELTQKQIGEVVTLTGWVSRRRDHGGVIFIDLRDRYGITQIKFDPEHNVEVHTAADALRSEWVIAVTGKVTARPADMINPKIDTGVIEIAVSSLEILNTSITPPFEVADDKGSEANEGLRLKYRYIDLRRSKLQKMLVQKDQFIRDMRSFFHARDFCEVQTPILANSSPEGARDWLVPSRLYHGKFYALPQAPQQFKQLLMVGGVDKYFQIAPCFRDEDPRMDRHFGEFYQLDFEMSFVEQEDILSLLEELWIDLTRKHSTKKIASTPFPRIPWRTAMERYGSDKPDLRFGLEIINVSEIVTECGFGVFAQAVSDGGVVHALKVDGGGKFSRKNIDDLTELAKTKGAKGLAYIIIKEDGSLQSPIAKFLGEDVAQKIISAVKGHAGDIIFFGADTWRTVCDSLGVVRSRCGDLLDLKDPNVAAWAFIVDFPMYDYSEIEDGKIDFSHNPFSMPQGGLNALNTQDPLDIVAYQFDIVLNGFELSSGAIRNHDPKIMYRAFEIAGYTEEQVDAKFGHMINAFKYGAPPHGGSAPGIDRAFMVLTDCDSIRDIYAFPKDGQGRDVMLDAPSVVEPQQLKELGIKIVD
jgi:aspartyl-tRNA synthetase